MVNKNLRKEVGWLLKEKYFNKPTKNFEKDIGRLKNGEPLDYVIGFTEFLGCKIDLSKRPLIPRPETEFWTEKAIEEIRKVLGCMTSQCLGKRKLRVLDVFAGSGCIGIAILKHVPNSLCDFSDINRKNLKQIKINLKINKIKENRYKIINADIFKQINPSSLRLLRAKYDFVFANPPYIALKNKNKIQKSVLNFEPKSALFGGEDGLFYIRKFLKEAKNHLKNNGRIYMEFGSEQKKEIEKIIVKNKYSNCKFYKDQYGKWRYVVIS